ncbi:hypothetical protein V1514DRAFT_68858 [Lipomyces japonicus]|uniref:uncharacterized protein n=1 Tax=Lipomyces japonicus TaxID=56871 RepID=UPI0034CEFF71
METDDRNSWSHINGKSLLIFCTVCFRGPSNSDLRFYLETCGHAFCEHHLGYLGIENLSERSFPIKHPCPKCSNAESEIFWIRDKLPTEFAIYFQDSETIIDRAESALRYQIDALVRLVRHYQAQESEYDTLRNKINYQDSLLASMRVSLEQGMLLKEQCNNLIKENAELRQQLSQLPRPQQPAEAASKDNSEKAARLITDQTFMLATPSRTPHFGPRKTVENTTPIHNPIMHDTGNAAIPIRRSVTSLSNRSPRSMPSYSKITRPPSASPHRHAQSSNLVTSPRNTPNLSSISYRSPSRMSNAVLQPKATYASTSFPFFQEHAIITGNTQSNHSRSQAASTTPRVITSIEDTLPNSTNFTDTLPRLGGEHDVKRNNLSRVSSSSTIPQPQFYNRSTQVGRHNIAQNVIKRTPFNR